MGRQSSSLSAVTHSNKSEDGVPDSSSIREVSSDDDNNNENMIDNHETSTPNKLISKGSKLINKKPAFLSKGKRTSSKSSVHTHGSHTTTSSSTDQQTKDKQKMSLSSSSYSIASQSLASLSTTGEEESLISSLPPVTPSPQRGTQQQQRADDPSVITDLSLEDYSRAGSRIGKHGDDLNKMMNFAEEYGQPGQNTTSNTPKKIEIPSASTNLKKSSTFTSPSKPSGILRASSYGTNTNYYSDTDTDTGGGGGSVSSRTSRRRRKRMMREHQHRDADDGTSTVVTDDEEDDNATYASKGASSYVSVGNSTVMTEDTSMPQDVKDALAKLNQYKKSKKATKGKGTNKERRQRRSKERSHKSRTNESSESEYDESDSWISGHRGDKKSKSRSSSRSSTGQRSKSLPKERTPPRTDKPKINVALYDEDEDWLDHVYHALTNTKLDTFMSGTSLTGMFQCGSSGEANGQKRILPLVEEDTDFDDSNEKRQLSSQITHKSSKCRSRSGSRHSSRGRGGRKSGDEEDEISTSSSKVRMKRVSSSASTRSRRSNKKESSRRPRSPKGERQKGSSDQIASSKKDDDEKREALARAAAMAASSNNIASRNKRRSRSRSNSPSKESKASVSSRTRSRSRSKSPSSTRSRSRSRSRSKSPSKDGKHCDGSSSPPPPAPKQRQKHRRKDSLEEHLAQFKEEIRSLEEEKAEVAPPVPSTASPRLDKTTTPTTPITAVEEPAAPPVSSSPLEKLGEALTTRLLAATTADTPTAPSKSPPEGIDRVISRDLSTQNGLGGANQTVRSDTISAMQLVEEAERRASLEEAVAHQIAEEELELEMTLDPSGRQVIADGAVLYEYKESHEEENDNDDDQEEHDASSSEDEPMFTGRNRRRDAVNQVNRLIAESDGKQQQQPRYRNDNAIGSTSPEGVRKPVAVTKKKSGGKKLSSFFTSSSNKAKGQPSPTATNTVDRRSKEIPPPPRGGSSTNSPALVNNGHGNRDDKPRTNGVERASTNKGTTTNEPKKNAEQVVSTATATPTKSALRRTNGMSSSSPASSASSNNRRTKQVTVLEEPDDIEESRSMGSRRSLGSSSHKQGSSYSRPSTVDPERSLATERISNTLEALQQRTINNMAMAGGDARKPTSKKKGVPVPPPPKRYSTSSPTLSTQVKHQIETDGSKSTSVATTVAAGSSSSLPKRPPPPKVNESIALAAVQSNVSWILPPKDADLFDKSSAGAEESSQSVRSEDKLPEDQSSISPPLGLSKKTSRVNSTISRTSVRSGKSAQSEGQRSVASSKSKKEKHVYPLEGIETDDLTIHPLDNMSISAEHDALASSSAVSGDAGGADNMEDLLLARPLHLVTSATQFWNGKASTATGNNDSPPTTTTSRNANDDAPTKAATNNVAVTTSDTTTLENESSSVGTNGEKATVRSMIVPVASPSSMKEERASVPVATAVPKNKPAAGHKPPLPPPRSSGTTSNVPPPPGNAANKPIKKKKGGGLFVLKKHKSSKKLKPAGGPSTSSVSVSSKASEKTTSSQKKKKMSLEEQIQMQNAIINTLLTATGEEQNSPCLRNEAPSPGKSQQA